MYRLFEFIYGTWQVVMTDTLGACAVVQIEINDDGRETKLVYLGK